MATSEENHLEATHHFRLWDLGITRQDLICSLIFLSGSFFPPYGYSSPICHQSLVPAASLQGRAKQSQALFTGRRKEDHWHRKEACVLAKGCATP